MSRVILKISGEALKGTTDVVAKEKLDVVLKTVEMLRNDHEIGIVIGGGNIFRGREHQDMDKVTGDTIGMLGTVMNALYLKDYLQKHHIPCIVSTPFTFPGLISDISDEELKESYDQKKIILFGGGVGKSGFSTDSGTILAASKVNADLIIKMTNVDGVYNDDPKINKNAQKFDHLSYEDVIKNEYKVMDSYAFLECKKRNIKILVLNFNDYAKINDYFKGIRVGTIVGD